LGNSNPPSPLFLILTSPSLLSVHLLFGLLLRSLAFFIWLPSLSSLALSLSPLPAEQAVKEQLQAQGVAGPAAAGTPGPAAARPERQEGGARGARVGGAGRWALGARASREVSGSSARRQASGPRAREAQHWRGGAQAVARHAGGGSARKLGGVRPGKASGAGWWRPRRARVLGRASAEAGSGCRARAAPERAGGSALGRADDRRGAGRWHAARARGRAEAGARAGQEQLG
jgi:hypothetical protein